MIRNWVVKTAFIFVFLFFLIFHWQHTQNQYSRNETYLKKLKKEVFLTKIKQPIPTWMRDQIQEDFQKFKENGISKKNIDATFSQIQAAGHDHCLVRYRILRNKLYRYFPEKELVSLEDNSTELALKTLLQCISLPDLDLIISFYDGVWPEDQYYFTPNSADQAPVLFSAKIKGLANIILFPDWRSIGIWWISDIKYITAIIDRYPWEKKKELALWRGSLTNKHRLELCQLSILNPQYIDAKINQSEELDIPAYLKGTKVSWEDLLQCKYLPYMDGVMCAAPALQWRLLSQSVVFKPDSNEIQWFYRTLQPFVHYIPVNSDLSDLIEKIDWAKSHDEECKQIAFQARQFAIQSLMYEDVLLYFYQVLKTYASVEKIDRTEMEQEMNSDPRWVKIHYRVPLQKNAKRCQMKGYHQYALPW